MSDQLSKDQLRRIKATLKRIRGGLAKSVPNPNREPSHIFDPKALADDQK